MRPDEYAAYSAVFEAQSVTMTELARQLGLPVTTTADYVRAMRERKHVRRTPHPTDSRAYLLSLTASGLRAHRRASLAFTTAHDAFVAGLGPLGEGEARAALGHLSAAARTASQALQRSSRRMTSRPRAAESAR